MKRTYNEIHRTDKNSEHSSIILTGWPNGFVFVYELSGFGFKSSCSHLRKAFANNILTYVKLSKIQLTKMSPSSGFLCKALRNMKENFSKNALLDLSVPLPKLATKATSYVNTFGCFIDSTCGLFINTPCSFFIEKYCNQDSQGLGRNIITWVKLIKIFSSALAFKKY